MHLFAHYILVLLIFKGHIDFVFLFKCILNTGLLLMEYFHIVVLLVGTHSNQMLQVKQEHFCQFLLFFKVETSRRDLK